MPLGAEQVMLSAGKDEKVPRAEQQITSQPQRTSVAASLERKAVELGLVTLSTNDSNVRGTRLPGQKDPASMLWESGPREEQRMPPFR